MADINEKARVEVLIDGAQAARTIKDQEAAIRKLRAEWRGLDQDTEAYKQVSKSLDDANKKLREQKAEISGTSKAFSLFKNNFMSLATGMAAGNLISQLFQKGLSALVGAFKSAITGAAELSDELADIRKTTGMSSEEVKTLNSELSKIDTRTSTKELRSIAAIAGQLGIAKEDILSFTAATDKLNVALGDEFQGGAEEITKTLGGLRKVLKDSSTGDISQDMLHIGNALNALGAAGSATSPVVADFANRIGSVGSTLGLTSGQILGLSAALQEMNVSTERGGTAVTKILLKMTKNYEDFAKVAGMKTNEFKDLVNKDIFSAFLKVAEGSQKTASAATNFSAMLDKLGIDGSGASEVFSKLGGNISFVSDKAKFATNALAGTSSIMSEFNIKNETFAAQIAKVGKAIYNMTLVPLGAFLQPLVSGILTLVTGPLDEATHETENLNTQLTAQAKKVKDLDTNIIPLADRYDVLKNKTNLNKREQDELKGIIEKLTTAYPLAANEVDKYGRTIGVSTEKIRENIELEKSRLQILNRDKIQEINNLMTQYAFQLGRIKEKLGGLYDNKPILDINPENAKHIDELNSKIKDLQDRLAKPQQFNDTDLQERNKAIADLIKAQEELANFNKKSAPEGPSLAISPQERQNMISDIDRLTNLMKGADAQLKLLKGEDIDALIAAGDQAVYYANKSKEELEKMAKAGDELAKAELAKRKDVNAGKEEDDKKYVDNTKKLLEDLAQAKANAIQDEEKRDEALAKSKYAKMEDEVRQTEADESVKAELIKQYQEDLQRNLDDIHKKFFDKRTQDEFNESKKYLEEWQLKEREALDQKYKNGEIGKKEYDQKVREMETSHLQEMRLLYTYYQQDVTDIDKKILKDKRRNNDDELRDEQILLERKKEFLNMEADNAEAGSRRWLEKKKELLNIELEQELAMTTLTEEQKQAIREKFNKDKIDNSVSADEQAQAITDKYIKKTNDLESDHYKKIAEGIQKYGGMVGNVYSSINSAITARENKELASDQRITDEKKKSLENQLKKKLISEEEYNRRIADLDEQMDKKTKEVRHKQAEREKALAIFKATVQTAAAIVEALPNIPLSIIAGAVGAAEIGSIIATPLPEMAHGGDTMRVMGQSGQRYNTTFVGSFAKGGRYSSASLGIIGEKGRELVIPNWLYEHPRMVNTWRVVENMIQARAFASGGPTVSASPSPSSSLPIEVSGAADFMRAAEKMERAADAMLARLSDPIEANISYTRLENASKDVNLARRQASL